MMKAESKGAALASGKVVTTTWHEQGVSEKESKQLSVEVVKTGKVIGYVRSQEMEGEYTYYR